MNFFIAHQLNFMMVLSGICAFIFLFLITMKIDGKFKKYSFLQMAFFAMLLLVSDRFAYIYRGNETTLGYWMVRISNFLVYASILMVENSFNNYLFSLAIAKKLEKRRRIILQVSRYSSVFGLILLFISQFIGLYYTFDATNHYQRAPGFIICYLMPLFITLLQFIFIVKNKNIFSKSIIISLFIFVGTPLVASIVQIMFYGLSLTSISISLSCIFLYFFALFDQNRLLNNAAAKEMNRAKEMQERSNELLQQTVEALASAVEADDSYTHGHSARVAKYAKKIAIRAGMSEEECEKVYLAGLLHDIGKIGIDDRIINKRGKLTDEEYDIVKDHPVLGEQILSKIVALPSLSVGAHYHHERYNGTGYPEQLKGEEIPVIARIIAVADAYDAMTSERPYRDLIPQMQVREQLLKGSGTQFDPKYARIMLHLLDEDEEYKMKERQKDEVLSSNLVYEFGECKTQVSPGLRITDCPVFIELQYKSLKDGGEPGLLFYDSSDAKYYFEHSSLSEEMDFIEYGQICLCGKVTQNYVRKVQQKTTKKTARKNEADNFHSASIQLVKQDDHLLVKISTEDQVQEVIFALHDESRFLYLALTGADCLLRIYRINVSEKPVGNNYVPRIAERISYIDGPQGDIPNFQINTWRGANSEVMELKNKLEISFDSMSLPTSRRVWHCPYICLFTSDDGKINGNNYKEVAIIRMDGEVWCDHNDVQNKSKLTKKENFQNWDVWLEENKKGVSYKIRLSHNRNKVDFCGEDSNLIVLNETTLPHSVEKLYCFLTGDQCAITNIRIN